MRMHEAETCRIQQQCVGAFGGRSKRYSLIPLEEPHPAMLSISNGNVEKRIFVDSDITLIGSLRRYRERQ